jgi:hypothetical protein
MLTGFIEKFFEENNITIDIFADCNYGTKLLVFAYNILLPNTHWNKYYEITTLPKNECRKAAYLKAAEILEKQIEGSKKNEKK